MLVNSSVFDHTNNNPGGTEADGYATRLTGATGNKQYGLARSLSVMPGDTVKVGVYAKYIQRDGSGNWPAAVAGLMSAITSNAAGVVVDGGLEGSLGNGTFPFAGFIDKSTETGTVPKAYLNYIVFDRDYAMLDFGYLRTTAAASEDGTNRPHEHLFKDDIIVNKPGYVYIYLSNENETSVEVFFDDFRVEHVKGPVVQMDDYYPFGLTYNSYSKENSIANRWKFQGQEHTLDEGFLDFGITNEIVTDYKPYKSIEARIAWSFPVTIVAHYDPLRGESMLKSIKANAYYAIDFKRTQGDYEIVNIDELMSVDCSKLENKIILFGYLGPKAEDTVISPLDNESSRTYRTLIIANIISNLLEEHSNEKR